MALSRPLRSPTSDEVPQASSSVAAATSATAAGNVVPTSEQAMLLNEHDEELIRIRADMVCVGCRCGWLCCDCKLGCMYCKQRRHFCYCHWILVESTGRHIRIHCGICVDLRASCQCQLTFRCKWCSISLEKCRRGGCVTLLPKRESPEAEPYVEIFNNEDKTDDDEVGGEESSDDGADKWSLISSVSNVSVSTSLLTWRTGSPEPDSTLSRSESVSSLVFGPQGEWWENQPLRRSDECDDDLYSSTQTVSSVSSVTSGGSYSSVGGKSDF